MKKSRNAPEVNAGSMADIAFLLLIFFLVTTTIAEDKGILVRLPVWDDTQDQQIIDVASRNVFKVFVNAEDQLLVNGEEMNVKSLKDAAKEFIMNPRKRVDMASSPKKAIISLKNDRGTSYDKYITVYNELKASYNELRNEEAKRRYSKSFEFLNKSQQKEIRNAIPLIISESEPTDLAQL